jgi:predicted Zn-dependent protease
MKQLGISFLLLGALTLVLAAPPPAAAQLSSVRGNVIDENGEPMKDVQVTFEFKGETRGKREWSQKTDKSGGFVRMGLPSGPYKIRFDAEGYRPYSIDIYFSLGGLSEVPDVQMQKLPEGVQLSPEQRAEMARQAADEEAKKAAEAAAEDAKRLGATYGQAIEAIKGQEWDEAERLLREFLVESPDTPQAHFNLGFIYMKRGQLPEAEVEYRKVTELETEKSDAFIALAAIYEQQGKMDEAFGLLQGAATSFAEDAAFQTALGAIAMNTGNEALAEEAFARAVELDPAQVEVQFHLATLALNRGQTDDAIGHLEGYVAAAPAGSPNLEVATALLEALKKQQ